jgi:sec-independent protein translocase protein TatA
MFGIGGGELIFIMFIVLMLFGSDKVPEMARTMGKAMAQLKNATNEIKNEIQKGAVDNGFDQNLISDFRGKITSEIDSAKTNLLGGSDPLKGITDSFSTEVDKVKNSISDENPVSRNPEMSTKSPEIEGFNEVQTTTANEIEESAGPIKRKK